MVKLGTSTLMFSVRFRVLVFLEKFREYFFFTGNCVYGRAMLSIGLISLLIAVPLGAAFFHPLKAVEHAHRVCDPFYAFG